MEVKIKQSWLNIRNSLWFLPTLMALSAVILALALIGLDRHLSYNDLNITWFLYSGQRQGARSVLSTIASSMVTIAGVTLSITLVALTMASQQFGPRLLRNFIADKSNQVVIGTFIATFIYSLIVLLTIHGTDENEFVPKLSVVFAFVLAVFSLGVIIFFIHHVTTSIQADYIIKDSFRDFHRIADALLLNENEKDNDAATAEEMRQALNSYQHNKSVHLNASGFVQTIDYNSICQWAQTHDAGVCLSVDVGSFVSVYEAFATVFYTRPVPENVEEELQACLVIGYQRTPNEDLLFSLKQIVEVGVRALSPGINDPHTAVTCIQWLGAALSIIAKKKLKAPVVKDGQGNIRVVQHQVTYDEMLQTCFNHLRLYARTNIYVMAEIMTALKRPMLVASDKAFRDKLQQTAEMIHQEVHQQYGQNHPRQLIDHLFRELMQVYEERQLLQ